MTPFTPKSVPDREPIPSDVVVAFVTFRFRAESQPVEVALVLYSEVAKKDVVVALVVVLFVPTKPEKSPFVACKTDAKNEVEVAFVLVEFVDCRDGAKSADVDANP